VRHSEIVRLAAAGEGNGVTCNFTYSPDLVSEAELRGGIMDTDEIFTALTQRNALRRQAKLPLLDVKAEYAHQVGLAAGRDYAAACERFADERARIREQVLADFRAVHGPGFGLSFGGRWAVGHETNQRFHRYMDETHGVHAPAQAAPNSIVYGSARRDNDVSPSASAKTIASSASIRFIRDS
jgi:hypothetical protein